MSSDDYDMRGGARSVAPEVGGDPAGPIGFEPSLVFQAFGSQKLSAFTLILESWRRGLTVRIESPRTTNFTVSDGERSVSFNGSRSSLTTREAIRTVDNKHQTLDRLRSAHVPVPKSRLFRLSRTSFEELLTIAERDYRWPVVIKPVRGSQGDGVFANITSAQELHEGYKSLAKDTAVDRILLEEHAHGDDYRIYVVGDVVVGGCRRVPANVVGDGYSTVSQLVSAKNDSRKRNPFLSKGLIRRDVEIDSMLKRQGLNYQSVPNAGVYVQLRQKANASAGGDVVDVTDDLPETVKTAAVSAVRSVEGLAAAGVDVLLDRNANTASESFVIIELNARAHIGVNMYPTHGVGVNAPKAIIDHFFPFTVEGSATPKTTLGLNLDSLLSPLRDGSASHVELSQIPDHAYPVRRKTTIRGDNDLTVGQRNRILLASRRFGISGSLEARSGSVQLVSAGEGDGVNAFLSRVETILNIELPPSTEWCGTVLMGFYFSDEPLLRD